MAGVVAALVAIILIAIGAWRCKRQEAQVTGEKIYQVISLPEGQQNLDYASACEKAKRLLARDSSKRYFVVMVVERAEASEGEGTRLVSAL